MVKDIMWHPDERNPLYLLWTYLTIAYFVSFTIWGFECALQNNNKRLSWKTHSLLFLILSQTYMCLYQTITLHFRIMYKCDKVIKMFHKREYHPHILIALICFIKTLNDVMGEGQSLNLLSYKNKLNCSLMFSKLLKASIIFEVSRSVLLLLLGERKGSQ